MKRMLTPHFTRILLSRLLLRSVVSLLLCIGLLPSLHAQNIYYDQSSGHIYGHGFVPYSSHYISYEMDNFLMPGTCMPGGFVSLNADKFGMIESYSFLLPCPSSMMPPQFDGSMAVNYVFPSITGNGDNYNNYQQVDVCSGTYPNVLLTENLYGSVAYTDNISTYSGCSAAAFNTKEKVYAVRVEQDALATTAPTQLNVIIKNNTDAVNVFLMQDLTSGTCTNMQAVPIPVPGTCAALDGFLASFSIPGEGAYIIYVESASSYDITFGAITGTMVVLVPASPAVPPTPPVVLLSTKGVWERDDISTCAFVNFKTTDKSYELKLNGTVAPTGSLLTFNLAPVVNKLCIKQSLRNLTGNQGIRKIEYNFGPALTATPVSATSALIYNDNDSKAALYNMFGAWQVSTPAALTPASYIPTSATGLLASAVKWNFNSTNGRGDFNPAPNSCLIYEFCFNIVATNNVPDDTKVVGVFYPDNVGRGGTIPGSPGLPAIPAHNETLSLGCYKDLNTGCGSSVIPTCILPFICEPEDPPITIDFEDPAPPVPLPVKLINFAAFAKEQQVEINWTTATELNNDYFTIERSTNGSDFADIGTVRGNSTTNTEHSYRFIDTKVSSGLYYYRLRQTDFDGTSEHSATRNVRINGSKTTHVAAYPNPVHDNLTIRVSQAAQADYTVRIFSQIGVLMLTQTNNQPQIDIDMSTLSSGIYIVETTVEGSNFYEKIVKQ